MRSGITLGRLIASMDKPCRRLRRPPRSKRLVRVRRDHVVERVDDQPKTHRGANNDDGGDDDEGNGCIHGGSFGNRHGGGVPVRTRKRIFGTLR
jgi:hypothetical protein